jgi:hypothetical protein
MKPPSVDPVPLDPSERPAGTNPVASALRALASCVEFLLAGGRRDLRRERQKLNEAQRLIADIEAHADAGHGLQRESLRRMGPGTTPKDGGEAAA